MNKETETKFIAYRMTDDAGFAPNPFHKVLTLATCKPKIRKSANKGDWVIGLSSKTLSNTRDEIVYVMQVKEALAFNEYFKDKRFQKKKPNSKSQKTELGDNIYRFKNGKWFQSKNKSHDERSIKRDTSVNRVLISNRFYYFGKETIAIPNYLQDEVRFSNQGHKFLSKQTSERLIKFLEKKYGNKFNSSNPSDLIVTCQFQARAKTSAKAC